VLALVKDGVGVAELRAGEAGEVVLDSTSFYADRRAGGDVGWLMGAGHSTTVADVSGASKPVQGVWAHRVVARERIAIGDTVDTSLTPRSVRPSRAIIRGRICSMRR